MRADDALKPLQRAAWILTGLLWFLWLGPMGDSADGSVLVAAAACLALALSALRRRPVRPTEGAPGADAHLTLLGRRLDLRVVRLGRCSLTGFAAGLLVGPLAALLELVKVGLHGSSGVPPGGPASVLVRTPAWALAGLCLGAALGLMMWVLGTEDGDARRAGRPGRVQSPRDEEW